MGSPCEIQLFAGTARSQAHRPTWRSPTSNAWSSAIHAIGTTACSRRSTAWLPTAAVSPWMRKQPACSTTPRPATGRATACSTSPPAYSGAPGASTRDSCPIRRQIDGLMPSVGWHQLRWEPPHLEFAPGMEIDFGGIVKEYAVDRVATLCWNAGAHHGVVNLGGDIRIIGPRPDGAPWRIGIQHPRRKGAVIESIRLHSGQRGQQRRLRALHRRRRRPLRARAESEDRLAGAPSRLGERRRRFLRRRRQRLDHRHAQGKRTARHGWTSSACPTSGSTCRAIPAVLFSRPLRDSRTAKPATDSGDTVLFRPGGESGRQQAVDHA